MEKTVCGKKFAVTGCTGGLGKELCFKLAEMGAELIMLDRNQQKSAVLENELKDRYPDTKITRIETELENMASVNSAVKQLIPLKPDYFIANAGAYSIPRHICESGYDNVFQINFVSPYYIIRRLHEENPDIKIIAVGSIAHTYSKINDNDIDFRTYKSSAKAYGNSKRYLMLSLSEYFKSSPDSLSIVHPGITFTNITAHYPKIIFAVIKHPMKIIFMKPKKAVLCLLEGVFTPTEKGYWIGPRIFGIWGKPKKQKLKAAFSPDIEKASETAEEIYQGLRSLFQNN